GRPHPMIDQSLRLDRFAVEAADPATAVILLDVVLGHGAHPDPARELAPAIAAAGTPVVVSLIGARADPQDFNEQASMLQKAGALGISRDDTLHAGPPITWQRASGPMRGALMGAAAYEGLVADPERAVAFYEAGAANLMPCHDHGAVGPMAGIVSSSMWVFVL